MNGGGPLGTSLRALRYPPVLVDDAGVVARLTAAAGPGDALLDAEELVRWARAWMVACQGLLHERGVIGAVPPWTVPLAVADLPALKGDPEHRRRDAALALLENASLLRFDPPRRSVSLDSAAFVEHRAAVDLDWGAAVQAARLEPASLLVLRALAESIVPPAEPTAVTLGELADRTGYAPKQVRIALRRLVDAGVLITHESAGMATRYCFGTVAMPGVPVPARPVAAPSIQAPPPVQPPAPAGGRSVALRLTLNGVTLTLGPGLSPHVEIGPDGVPHLTLDG